MARKTRKEKIIAELRRKLKVTQDLEKGEEKIENKETKESLKIPTITSKARIGSEDQKQNSLLAISPYTPYIKKDLTKTLILAILAISLELILYFLDRAGKF